MKKLNLAVTLAVSGLGLAIAGAATGQDRLPETEVPAGSRIRLPVEYRSKPADLARGAMSRLAMCVYEEKPVLVDKLLDYSDPVAFDPKSTGIKGNWIDRLGLLSCLSREALDGAVELRFTPGALHYMLTEAAYLSANPMPPSWLAEPRPAAERQFVATGKELALAQALAELADCMVAADPAHSDELLRTTVTSDGEQAAARKLAPALGGCLYQGQALDLTPANIRGWAASGLWQAERQRARSSGTAN